MVSSNGLCLHPGRADFPPRGGRMRRASARGPRKVAGVCEMGTTCIAQKRAPGKLYPRAAGQREPKGGPPRRAGAPAGADAFLGGSVCVPARAVRAGAGPLEHFAEENICKTDIFLRFRRLAPAVATQEATDGDMVTATASQRNRCRYPYAGRACQRLAPFPRRAGQAAEKRGFPP